MSKYYRKPSFVVSQQSDCTFAFTMRLTNTLFAFGIKKANITAIDARMYALRFPRYYIGVDPQEEANGDSKREDPTDL